MGAKESEREREREDVCVCVCVQVLVSRELKLRFGVLDRKLQIQVTLTKFHINNRNYL